MADIKKNEIELSGNNERLFLCPCCGECPEIIINKEEKKVIFYEDGKEFILSKEAWNELIRNKAYKGR